jgi:lipoprotein-anchoring transpeptidase ErfK/SrfK
VAPVAYVSTVVTSRSAARRFGLLVTALAGAVVLAGCGMSMHPEASTHVAFHVPPTPTVDLAVAAPAGSTLVAALHGDTPGSATPGGPATQIVPGQWYQYPSILPVINSVPNWVEIRIAQRPNESTAWVPQSDVTLSTTPYKVVVNLATEHLSVFKDGAQIMDFPAGIGAPDDPTTPGHFFITMSAPPPDPGYGAFVLVTSAHSDTITDWGNSGDAIIAIHGPIDSYDDSLIGTTGAAISHGCIRLHDADLAQMGMLTPGTPVDIVSS